MDAEFVNRTTLMLALRTICSQTLLSDDCIPLLPQPFSATDRVQAGVTAQGIAPLPGIFVSWRGTEQTIHEVLGASTWTIAIDQHTPLSEVLRNELPLSVAIKTVHNTVERSFNQREIGIIRELPISWDTSHFTSDRIGVFALRGTFVAIPTYREQTLHVIAQIRIRVARNLGRRPQETRSVSY